MEGDRSDRVFERAGVDIDATIGEEDIQAVLVAVDVSELFAEAGSSGDVVALVR